MTVLIVSHQESAVRIAAQTVVLAGGRSTASPRTEGTSSLSDIDRILPATVAWSERFDHAEDVSLFPEEEALIANAAASRRREFATGRLCAREALRKLGLPWGPIGRSEGRAPQWPPGVVGSITHCPGYCAATAALASDLVTIGIDAEPDLPLPGEVGDRIAQPGESAHLSDLSRMQPNGPAWDRLLFCAKEAVYKAWFPLTSRWLDFDQVTVNIQPESEAFDVRLLVPGPVVGGQPIARFTGRWLAFKGLIVCTVAVAA